ncbi:MAG: hypothetical protein BZ138_03655, partial [Methanosphaera sp. rholeuAM270]
GNDVVLAWFYDSSDCVHVGGTAYKSVRGSETGPRLYNPKSYMDKNKIYYICTSSDHSRHKKTADYTGTKTAKEFMKLFKTDTKTTVTKTQVKDATVTITGTVKTTGSKNVDGSITIKDSQNKILKKNIKVKNGQFKTSVTVNKPGTQKITVTYNQNNVHKASSTTCKVVIPKNYTMETKQYGNTVSNTNLVVTLYDDKTKKIEKNKIVYVKFQNGTIRTVRTDKKGRAVIKINDTKSVKVQVYVRNSKKILNSKTVKVTVNKNAVKVTVDKVVKKGNKIVLTAHIISQNNRKVNGGNLVFKINGKTLRVDNTLNSNKSPLKLKVKNGIVSVSIPVNSKIINERLSAVYSGSYKYKANTSNVVKIKI